MYKITQKPGVIDNWCLNKIMMGFYTTICRDVCKGSGHAGFIDPVLHFWWKVPLDPFQEWTHPHPPIDHAQFELYKGFDANQYGSGKGGGSISYKHDVGTKLFLVFSLFIY